jgi:hypothetical protein
MGMLGLSVTDASAAAVAPMVSVADFTAPAHEAVIATAAAPPVLVTVHSAELCPAATVTVAGREIAFGSETTIDTVAPPSGAGPVSTTVAVLDPPGAIASGFSERDSTASGASVKDASRAMPPYAAETVTLVVAATVRVRMA